MNKIMRNLLLIAVCCLVACAGVSAQKLTPGKEIETKPTKVIAIGSGASPIFASSTSAADVTSFWKEGDDTICIGAGPHERVRFEPSKVTVSRPAWLLATNWITTAYLLPAVRELPKPEGNIVTVVQRSQVTSNFVMVVSWQVSTNQVTNTFVMQSVPVPEWSGVERWGQELVQVGR